MNLLATLSWPSIGMRIAAVVLALYLWHWTQAWIARRTNPLHGLGDLIHDLTAPWHRYLSAHPRAANALLIVSSLFIDLLGLSIIALAVFGSSFAPFVALLILFGLRQISQAICSLPPPPGMIWRHPGCPALLVTYEVGNDFFFSGHTALAVLATLELAQFGSPWLTALAITICLAEMLTVLVLRAHYTLDVIAGAAVAFFAFELSSSLAPLVDSWFI